MATDNISTKRGFGLAGIVVIVVGGIIVAALGYLAYSRIVGSNTPATTQTEQTRGHIHDTMKMPSVDTSKDLDQAIKSLDDTSFDNDGNTELDAQAGGI